MTRRDVVLTGLPLSGTTLACLLLNKLPDTVALSEPFNPGMFAEVSSEEEACDVIERFYRRMRRKIRRHGVAISKHVGGEVTNNLFGDTRSETGKRRRRAGEGNHHIQIADPRLLAGDQNPRALYRPPSGPDAPGSGLRHHPQPSLRADLLEQRRDTGRTRPLPPCGTYDENLARQLSTQSDGLERQLRLLSWWYERFYTTLDRDHIIPYEDRVLTGGGALARIDPAASALREHLSTKNLNPLYSRDEMRSLGERLLGSEGSYWRFYPRESVREVLTQVT